MAGPGWQGCSSSSYLSSSSLVLLWLWWYRPGWRYYSGVQLIFLSRNVSYVGVCVYPRSGKLLRMPDDRHIKFICIGPASANKLNSLFMGRSGAPSWWRWWWWTDAGFSDPEVRTRERANGWKLEKVRRVAFWVSLRCNWNFKGPSTRLNFCLEKSSC